MREWASNRDSFRSSHPHSLRVAPVRRCLLSENISDHQASCQLPGFPHWRKIDAKFSTRSGNLNCRKEWLPHHVGTHVLYIKSYEYLRLPKYFRNDQRKSIRSYQVLAVELGRAVQGGYCIEFIHHLNGSELRPRLVARCWVHLTPRIPNENNIETTLNKHIFSKKTGWFSIFFANMPPFVPQVSYQCGCHEKSWSLRPESSSQQWLVYSMDIYLSG